MHLPMRLKDIIHDTEVWAPSSGHHRHWPLSAVGDGCISWAGGSSSRASWNLCVLFDFSLTFALMVHSYNSRVLRDYCGQGAIAIGKSKIQELSQYPGQSYSSYLWWPTPKLPLFETVAPPLKIFHPIFYTFLARRPTVQPSIKDLIKSQELTHLISEIYADETSYASELRDKLPRMLGVSLSKEENPNRISADGL